MDALAKSLRIPTRPFWQTCKLKFSDKNPRRRTKKFLKQEPGSQHWVVTKKVLDFWHHPQFRTLATFTFSENHLFRCAGKVHDPQKIHGRGVHPPCLYQTKKNVSVKDNESLIFVASRRSKSKALSSMSRMSISWYGKTQARTGAFWAHPGCDLSHPSNGDQSIQEFQRTDETFPFWVRPNLALRIFLKVTFRQNPPTQIAPEVLTEIGGSQKKYLRLWGGREPKVYQWHGACHWLPKWCVFCWLPCGRNLPHPWDTPPTWMRRQRVGLTSSNRIAITGTN